ncbi:hypothetical protein [Glycomyces paridis]|uniref:Uncharacterized protein n=1 Tax=Glycomyces paridis TaxID=2126555 RepID=A0A4V4HMV3_9ACTN|nr:hypothetical protein [Glycomyces paridis]THV23566.1 hypothetical protein E9998_22485 [Glycomyces paridis]
MGNTQDDQEHRWQAGPQASRGARWFSEFAAAAHRQSARYGREETAEEAEQRKREDWWELGPVFSTTDRGARITSLDPSREPGRFSGRLVAFTVGGALAWTAFSYLGFAELPDVGATQPGLHDRARTWWWVVLIVLALKASGLATWRLRGEAQRQFRQQSVVKGLALVVASFGITAGAALHFAAYASALGDGEANVEPPAIMLFLAVPFASVLAVRAPWVPFALWRVQRRQRRIQQLRGTGRRFDGEVASLRFTESWAGGKPRFEVLIRYEHAGVRRDFSTAMVTDADRVPLPGFPVRIMVDERSATLVEPDGDRPGYDFESNWAKYVQPSGDG